MYVVELVRVFNFLFINEEGTFTVTSPCFPRIIPTAASTFDLI